MAFRMEVAAVVLLLPVALLLPVNLVFKALILSSMFLVLVTELLNSAIEWVVDYISKEQHPLAKRAKDMGSAAVLFALVNSGVMWGLALWEWWTL
jgi:diacylglycerol kinase (ATP)